jgi:hypothetical protein
MSARQNKKRKGRNNLNNRERTVTTFTEDPNTSFLVPLPSEEPPSLNIMSSPFSDNNNNNSNVPFQIPTNFGMYMTSMHGPNPQQPPPPQHQHQQQQHQFFPSQVMLPPGNNDLQVLENLKTIIKEGQHEFYRAIPKPAALASLYLGPTTALPHIQPHPEQQDYHSPYRYDNSTPEDSNPHYPSDPIRRPTDTVLKDAWKSATSQTAVNVHILDYHTIFFD